MSKNNVSMYDVAVIGCGVAGCFVSKLLSEKGLKVIAIEEHPTPGKPNKCTGLVSWRIKNLVDLDESLIQNTVRRAEFISPKGEKLELKSKKPVIVIDRKKLDYKLYKESLEAGTEIKTKERFIDFKYVDNGVEIITNKGKYFSKILVGADGAFSRVAATAGLKQPSNIFYGLQATVKGNYEKDKVELWFGKKIAPEFFGWVVPISPNKAKVGIASKKKPLKYFNFFLKKRCRSKAKPDTAGIIRFGLMKKTVGNRLLLVGDAAAQVKPFSGGGIVYSLIASRIAVLTIRKAINQENYSEEFFMKNYDKLWKEKLAAGIKKGMFIRKVLYLLGDTSVNFWINFGKLVKFEIEKWDMDLIE